MKENSFQSQAGRGFLFISSAKIYFLITSALVNLGLPRIFGNPSDYGDYRVVSNFLSIVTMVIITGTMQAVSRLVSERPAAALGVVGRTCLTHLFIGAPAFLIFFFLAGPIAERCFADANLAPAIRAASFVILFYSFYSVIVGALNGLKRFSSQAALDATFSTLKTGFIIGLTAASFGVTGAFYGFSAASFLILMISLLFLKRIPGSEAADHAGGRTAYFLIPLLGYTLITNLLILLDVILLKYAVTTRFAEIFAQPGGMEKAGDALYSMNIAAPSGDFAGKSVSLSASWAGSFISGIMGAAKNLSLLSYQSVIPVAIVFFPIVAHSSHLAKGEEKERQINGALKFSAMLAAFVMVLISSEPLGILRMLFGEEYAPAAAPLILLAVSVYFFSIFYVSNALLTSCGFPRAALVCGAGAISVTVSLTAAAAFYAELGAAYFVIFSSAICLGMLFSFVASLALLGRFSGARIGLKPVVKITGGALILAVLLNLFNVVEFHLVVLKIFSGGVLFTAFLFLSKELTTGDIAALKKAVRKRG
ncbi:MAG: oligosaccharide flippase family protein [Deltaproteobacteria bacterium]|nr:oligosaccharide flippase family protein [Deltaproteobacteria bacterium]